MGAARPKEEGRPVKVGRNAPCPCGSGRKYKACCAGKTARRDTLLSKGMVALLGALLVAVAAIVASFYSPDRSAEAARVWSSEHGHLAYRGTGPYNKPLPLRIVTVIPSEDQLAFAVSERTGVTSLEEIRAQRVPLRVSLRKQPGHSTHFYVKQTLNAAGFSLDDIISWGGEVRYDAFIPQAAERLGAIERGEIDAVFDEAINRWLYQALDHGIRPLSLGGPLLARLEEMGFRRGIIPKVDYPKLPADVVSLDFSGWAVFTHADTPDDFITAFCGALEARRDRIPWQGEGPLPLEHMCRNTPDTPLFVPLHPAAERFWRDCGYLA